MEVLLMSIVGWVITIGIAIYTARSGAKDTAKKIAALEDSTTKQVESIKELAKMQIEVMALELDKEMAKFIVQAQQADEESKEISNLQNFNHIDIRDMAIKEFHDKQPQRDLRYHKKYINKLDEISDRLNQLKANLK